MTITENFALAMCRAKEENEALRAEIKALVDALQYIEANAETDCHQCLDAASVARDIPERKCGGKSGGEAK